MASNDSNAERDYDYGDGDSSSERSGLSFKRRRPSVDLTAGGERGRPRPRRSERHSSIGRGFANSPSSPVQVSDEGGEASREALSGRDRSMEQRDQAESRPAGGVGGGDPPEPFDCIPPSVCTSGVLSRLRHDFNI